MADLLLGAALVLAIGGIAAVLFTRWAKHWGATPDERRATMPGDAYFGGASDPRVAMTRAVTIDAPAQDVWPWLAQMGRGAGWYSYDWIDNGGKRSAQHIVSWIPEPRLGDASPIGYLRHLVPGAELTWWAGDIPLPMTRLRLVFDVRLASQSTQTRLVVRISADATGPLARPLLGTFSFLDSVMARRQLVVLRERVERYGDRTENPSRPESGARDQYQRDMAHFALGGSAGGSGRDFAAGWRRAAIEDGVLSRGADVEVG